MLVIRLRRQGAKRSPFYRIVVAEDANRRDGRFLEVIGHYNPRTTPEQVKIDLGRLAYWQVRGAQVSDTVRTLAVRHKQTPAGEPGGGPRAELQSEATPEAANEVAGAADASDANAAPATAAEPDGPGAEQATS